MNRQKRLKVLAVFLVMFFSPAAAAALTLAQGFDLADFPLLQYTFTGGEPSGTYFWFMALTSTGTTNVICGVVSSSFTFTPKRSVYGSKIE